VHGPLEAPARYLEKFKQIADEKRRTYAAMTAVLDDAVGQVTEKLKKEKLEERTLVFYFSDNGGPITVNASLNTPLRGAKAETLEGGIHVPFFVSWKGKLPAGQTYEKPVIQHDVTATTLAVAGAKVGDGEKPLDGVDLLPFLGGEKSGVPHETLYWRFGAQRAIRHGDWKLVRHRQSPEVELYNLATDIGESKDLAKEKPELVKELQARWDKWNSELVPPAWGNADRFGKPADPAKKEEKLKKRAERLKREE
jgi:arylsulfatase A-like enzyme